VPFFFAFCFISAYERERGHLKDNLEARAKRMRMRTAATLYIRTLIKTQIAYNTNTKNVEDLGIQMTS
jgi:hypothetical protein